ncbi:MAG: hypothetical protein ACRDZ2_00070 [Ilumatobacteraceae bacterium]
MRVPPSTFTGPSVPAPSDELDDRSPVQRLVGVPIDVEAGTQWSHDLVEQAIEECMADAGFSYVAVPFDAGVDPNEDQLAKLSASDARRYSQTLWGSDPSRPAGCERAAADRVYPANILQNEWEAMERQIAEDPTVRSAVDRASTCVTSEGFEPGAAPFEVQESCASSVGLEDAIYVVREEFEVQFIASHSQYFEAFLEDLGQLKAEVD